VVASGHEERDGEVLREWSPKGLFLEDPSHRSSLVLFKGSFKDPKKPREQYLGSLKEPLNKTKEDLWEGSST
jgi:hypothetical protein